MSASIPPRAIVIRPVLWRALFVLFAWVAAGIVLGALLIFLLSGESAHALRACLIGAAVGAVIGLAIIWRSLTVELGPDGLRGPTSWAGRITVALDELDWRTVESRGLAFRFGQQKIRALDGRHVVISRWSYAPEAMRDLDAELARLARERGA